MNRPIVNENQRANGGSNGVNGGYRGGYPATPSYRGGAPSGNSAVRWRFSHRSIAQLPRRQRSISGTELPQRSSAQLPRLSGA